MTPERWQQIKSLLNEALELPAQERSAFLNAACGDDLALRETLDEYLSLQPDLDTFLESGPLEKDHTSEDLTGAEFGRYRVVRELGRGGMGRVFLAERADQEFEQQVALKVVKRGMDTDQVLRRFRHERQILASLEHPNIARLYDGGVSEDGRPYFVMEYVDGEPVTEYCDRRRMDTEERLRLFRVICRSVEHAHRNLVVHRDLKPSNILVTAAGQVKLLDFGIAKLLSDDSGIASLAETKTGLRLMTPEYAAPEQVRGESVTTATDVYQLGIVLYELLTGQRPYNVAGRVRAEIERAIVEEQPTRPSTSITEVAKAKTRGTSIDRLRRRLAGDLDTIILKALRKETHRRYGSVEQLSEDVHRHLVGLPVDARGERLSYRASKFVRRNRATVAAGATIAVVLALLVLFHTVRVTAERDLARQEAVKSAQVSAFMTDLFNVGDPNLAPGGDTTTVRTLLQRGIDRVQADLYGQPDIQAHMQGVLGRIMLSRGHYDRARDLYSNARSLHFELGQDTSALVMQGGMGQALVDLGKMDEAEPLLREALDSLIVLGQDNSLAVATLKQNLGRLLYLKGDGEAALELIVSAVETRRAHPMTRLGRSEQAKVLNDLGSTLWSLGRFSEAEEAHLESLSLTRAVYGDTHPTVAAGLDNMASLYNQWGRYQEAEPLYREALRLHEDLLGRHHVQTLINTFNLGLLLGEMGRYEEGRAYVEDVGVRADSLFGGNHFLSPYIEGVLAVFQFGIGDYGAADDRLANALQLHRGMYGRGHKEQAMFIVNQARISLALGDISRAGRHVQDAYNISHGTYGDSHADVAKILYVFGNFFVRAGNLAAADTTYQKALEVFETAYVPDHIFALATRRALGRLRVLQGRPDEAIALVRSAIERHAEVAPYQETERARMQHTLGAALVLVEAYDEAEPLLEAATEHLRTAIDARPRDLAYLEADLASFRQASGRAPGTR